MQTGHENVEKTNGQYIKTEKYYQIKDEKYHSEFVIENTIGQYTGLKDENGKEIYEGDIVEYADTYKYIVCFGEYNINPKNCAEAITIGFYLKSIKSKLIPEEQIEHLYSIDGIGARFPKHCAVDDTIKESVDALKLKVIGNIYDNPELLAEKE